MSDSGTSAHEEGCPASFMGSVYTALSARRTAFDTLMWQVPALGLTAQAFLLTIAYGTGSSVIARSVAGALAFAVAVVAIQTMLKHRSHEVTDSLLLESLEQSHGIVVSEIHPHAQTADRGGAAGNTHFRDGRWWTKWSSLHLWIWLLSTFATAGGAAVVLALVFPSIF